MRPLQFRNPPHERPANRRAARPWPGPARAGRRRARTEAKARGADQAEAAVSMDVGPVGDRAAGRGGDAGVPARSRHGRHRVSRQAQGLGEHGRPDASRRSATRSRRPSASRGSPPRTTAPVCPIPTRSRASFPISICPIPGRSTPDAARDSRAACEAAAHGRRQRIGNSEGATLSQPSRLRVFGNSLGFIGRYPASLHSLSCVVVGVDGDEMQRDYWYSTAATGASSKTARAVGRTQRRARVARAQRAQARRPRRPGAVCRRSSRAGCSAISSARSAAAASIAAPRSCSMRPASRSSRTGCSSPSVRICPRRSAARRSTAKVSRRAIASWSRAACSTGYVLSTYSARKLGLRTTGNAGGVHNLIVRGSERDFDGLLRAWTAGWW